MEAEFSDRRRRRIIVLVGMLLAVVALAATYYLVTRPAATTKPAAQRTVVVAAPGYPCADAITEAMLKTLQVPDGSGARSRPYRPGGVGRQGAAVDIVAGDLLAENMYGTEATAAGLQHPRSRRDYSAQLADLACRVRQRAVGPSRRGQRVPGRSHRPVRHSHAAALRHEWRRPGANLSPGSQRPDHNGPLTFGYYADRHHEVHLDQPRSPAGRHDQRALRAQGRRASGRGDRPHPGNRRDVHDRPPTAGRRPQMSTRPATARRPTA